MDHQKHQSNIIKKILKDGDYYISVSGTTPGHYEIFTSMDQTTHKFQWSDGLLNMDNKKYACPDYAVSVIFDTYLNTLCDRYKFHRPYIDFNEKFGLPSPNRVENLQQFEYLYRDIEKRGLQPQHIALAKETTLFPGLQSLLKIKYDIDIKEDKNTGSK